MALTLSLTPLAPAHCEQDLVSAARRGDDRAFEELYSRYRERIAGFILAKVHDHGRAEDIAQDVFMSALRRLRANDQEIAFKPWIYEIAKNACIDEFRRSKRAREVSLDADEELTAGRRGLLSVAPTPPAVVESKQKLDDLQGAFGGLSDSHHKLLVMREFEGLSYNEIGARTGMSRQVVESTLFRARRKLTEEYDEIASGRRCEQVTTLIEEGGAQSLRSCGARQRRQLTRHLAYCQPCRRKARLAGVDESFVKPRSIAAKIAAFLPFPIWRWPWRGGAKGAATKGAAAKGAAAKGGSAGVGSIAGAAGSAGSSITLGQAAIAAAALAIAGAGGGAVTGVWSGKHVSRPTVNIRNASGPHSGGSAGAQGKTLGAPAPPAAAAGAAKAHRAAASGAAQMRVRQTSRRARGRVSSGAGGATPGGSAGAKGAAAPTGSPASSRAPASGQPSVVGAAGSTVTGTAKSAVSGVRTIVSKTVHTVLPTQGPAGSGPVASTVHKVTSTVGKVLPGAASTVSSTAGKVVSTVNGTASTVSGAAHDAGSAVGGVAHDAGSAATGAATKVTSTAGSTAAKVTSGAGDATKKVTSTAAAVASGILP